MDLVRELHKIRTFLPTLINSFENSVLFAAKNLGFYLNKGAEM